MKLTLIDKTGKDKDSLRVQKSQTKIEKSEITAAQIKDMIKFLQDKKERQNIQIDSEILHNQNLLIEIENLTKDVVITEPTEKTS